MGTIDIKYGVGQLDKYNWTTAKRTDLNRFDPSLLGLGDVAVDAKVINALAAVFDLEGFTDFCGQPDPQLVIPDYLSEFLVWLFEAITNRFKKGEKEGTVFLSSTLPFFAKFMGDGVLFLWNTDQVKTGHMGIGNITVCLHDICKRYSSTFLKKASKSYSKVPARLRVGLARGQVFLIGNGNDCVGPCINIASRLQKLGSLPFAISRRGFNPEKCFTASIQKKLIVCKTRLRGVGEDETIIVYRSDYNSIADEEKDLFTLQE